MDHETDFKLVPDGKATWALIAPAVWLVWHRLWLPLLAYLVFSMAVFLLLIWQPAPAVAYLSVLPGFYFLIEGRQLIANQMERNGWKFAGMVEGGNLEEAEIRFLAGNQQNVVERSVVKSAPNPSRINTVMPTGLFPE